MLRLLKEEPGSTFSDLWYRLGPTRPTLGVHCNVIRQKFGSKTVFIVEDPAGGQYYRLSEAAHFFLGLLDGRRTVDEAWESCNAQLGDGAPTQRECVDLLSRLQLFGLLTGELPLDAGQVELRRRQARTAKLRQRTGMGLAFTIPLLNPEPWLEQSKHILRGIFSRPFFIVWLLVVGVGIYHVLTNTDRLFSEFNHVIDPTNLAWAGLIFILLRGWHELGHAAACKAFGGRCTEIGLMLLLFVLPFPYCDASSAWRFPHVRHRVIVSAAGMLFETFLASIAAVLWAYSDPGTLRTVLYTTMVISGFTTLLFNLNPLLRYDGYYILSDLTGTANLWQRSREMWRFLVERGAFGIRAVRPPSVRDAAEFWLLTVYGALSFPYRIFVIFSIILLIWSNPHYLTLGAVLAAFAMVMMLLFPLAAGAWYLATSPKLVGRRSRAVGIVGGVLGVVVILLGVIPAPASASAPAIVRPSRIESIRPKEPGHVKAIHARAGQPVKAGDPIMTLENDELAAELAQAMARLAQATIERDGSHRKSITEQAVAQLGVDHARYQAEQAQARVDALTIRAESTGVLTPVGMNGTDLANLEGRYIPKGSLVALIASTDEMVIRAMLSDHDQAYVFPDGVSRLAADGVAASVRLRGRAGSELRASIVRFPTVGTDVLDEPSLGAHAGGEISLDPTDTKSQRSIVPRFLVELKPDESAGPLWSGLRGKARFAAKPAPLVSQWWRKLSQVFSERSQL